MKLCGITLARQVHNIHSTNTVEIDVINKFMKIFIVIYIIT